MDRRLILVVSAIVFVETSFYAVVAPLLPHYADDLHLSQASAGILLAAYPAGTLAGALPSGLLAARIGPRQTVLTGLALVAVASVTFAFAHPAPLLDAARFAQGIGGACIWSGGLAWLVAAAPPERRGETIGTALGAAIGGSLFGPVLGAIASALGTTPVFTGVGVLAAVLAGAVLTLPAPAAAPDGGASVATTVRAGRVRAGMWLVALPGLGFGALDTLVPLQLDDLGAGNAAVAAAFLVAAAGEAAISPLVGRVSDRAGRLAPIRFGLAAAAVVVLFVPAADSVLVTAALLVLATAALGTFWAPAMALLSDAAEAVGAHQGLAFGLVNLAWAVGMVIGAAGGGVVADAAADVVPFAIVSALCAGTLAAVLRRRAPVPA